MKSTRGKMKKTLTALLALGAVMLNAGSDGWAAFSSVSKATFRANVSLTAAGVVTVTAVIKKRSDNTDASELSWDPAAITLGSTQWLAAREYILLTSQITAATGGVQIYTDNKAAGAVPQYSGSGNPAGLVAAGNTAAPPLSMAWRVSDAIIGTAAELDIRRGATCNPNTYPDRLWSTEQCYPSFLWMLDQQTPDTNATTEGNQPFVNGLDYAAVKEGPRGIQHAEATFARTASPDYIYIGADFTGALTPESYTTNKLTLEAFTE